MQETLIENACRNLALKAKDYLFWQLIDLKNESVREIYLFKHGEIFLVPFQRFSLLVVSVPTFDRIRLKTISLIMRTVPKS